MNQTLPSGFLVDPIVWSVSVTVVTNGSLYGLTAASANVVNGILQRGLFTSFYVTGETPTNVSLPWNAPPEGVDAFSNVSIKSVIEAESGHVVNVTRLVIGKYGVVQYEIRFVSNPGFYPPGAGNIPLLYVTQNPATNGVLYPPQVYELVRGSQGISGTFDIDLHNDVGPRTVNFNETADRMMRKLEEMSSVGVVYVEASQYPSATSGGWGDNFVDDGTVGGYQWVIYFLRNPGVTNGFTFPPGSGDIDPITVATNPLTLSGTQVEVTVTTLQDGSDPIDGTFFVSFNDSSTAVSIVYNQMPIGMKYALESLNTIGVVSVAGELQTMQQVPGVYVSIARDGDTLLVEYDVGSATDVRDFFAAGDLLRIGGNDENVSFDGSNFYSLVAVTPESPMAALLQGSIPDNLILAGEELRIGFDSYTVLRTGSEVQLLSITCATLSSYCGDVVVSFSHNGITSMLPPIVRQSGGNLTSATAVQTFFESIPSVNTGDMTVSRQDSFDGLSFAFKIYFEGPSVLGNVNQVTTNGTCSFCTLSVVTLVEGGNTESQRLQMNVDAGYLTGSFISLVATDSTGTTNYSTSCFDFGVESSVLASLLQNLPVLSNQVLPFTVTITGVMSLQASNSVYGILAVGSNITVGSNLTSVYSIASISGTSIVLSPGAASSPLPSVGTSALAVGLFVSSAVQVARQGTGNSTSDVFILTVTADSFVTPGAGGFYRLRTSFQGAEKITTCIAYHASAADLSSAIDQLGFDFNGDGQFNSLDFGHIQVSRIGDGTSTSGYGYQYSLEMSGPLFAYGRSDVLGDSGIDFLVMDEGHLGGCNDMVGIETSSPSIAIDAVLSNGNSTWTTFGGVSIMGLLQVGSRIRVPGSAFPNQTYTVTATFVGGLPSVFTTDGILIVTSGAPSVTAFAFLSGIPSFTMEHSQIGEDSYSYDIFFTGPHLSVVPLMTASSTSCGPLFHVDGMLVGYTLSTTQAGGSSEQEAIYFSSLEYGIINTTGAYWKLVYNGVNVVTIVPSPSSGGYPWGIDPSLLQVYLATLGLNLTVTRTGFGSAEENFGFTYFINYPESLDNLSVLQVVTNGGISSPLYIPANITKPTQFPNDLSVTGVFAGSSQDVVFFVAITASGFFPINATVPIGDTFVWSTSVNATFSSGINITVGSLYPLSNGVSISFGSAIGHGIFDQWQFAGVNTNSSLPPGATIGFRAIASGAPSLNLLTLSSGYSGQAPSTMSAYREAPLFSVEDSTPLVFQLSTMNSSAFAIRTNYAGPVVINTTTTTCLSWNSPDFVVEAALNAVFAPICVDGSPCITVTRGVDVIYNFGGFVFLIYFENPAFATGSFSNALSVVNGGCLPYFASMFDIVQTQLGTVHRPFLQNSLPLASLADSTVPAHYRGIGVTRVPIYKVSGNIWGITFDSNLGDVPPLVAIPSAFLSDGAVLSVFDNVVQGVLPSSYVLNNAMTGVNYDARIQAYTRGPLHGYSPYSSPIATAVPASAPDAVIGFSATPVLNAFAVQQLIVAASRSREIQSITTSAASYPEEQLVTLTVPVGGSSPLAGGFALRFPETQVLQIQALTTLPTASYQLQYFYHDFDNFGSELLNQTTPCIDLNANAVDIASALEAISVIDQVSVSESGYGDYTSSFGYTYNIAFTGNLVAGTHPLMQVLLGSNASCSASSAFSGISFSITKAPAPIAVGLDTEIQSFSLSASQLISQGQYRLSFEYPLGNTQLTSCLLWNATSSDVTSALTLLSNIDDVFVDRYGTGDSLSSFGYSYNVFFVGNAMQSANRNSTLSTLQAIYSPGTCPGFDFAAFSANGVLEFISNSTFAFNSSVIQQGGFSLDASNTTASALAAAFALMPSYIDVNSTARSLSEDGYGYIYTVVFSASMGNVPLLACGMSSYLSGISGVCSPSILIEGNTLGGYFIVGTADPFPADVSAFDMQTALNEVSAIGTVAVTRTGPDFQGGYVWFVTFLTPGESVDIFTVSNLLTGSAASVVASIFQPMNVLGGTYNLSFNGFMSSPIPFNASPEQLSSILEQPSLGIGAVFVTLQANTSEQGSVYLITFTSSPGAVPLLVPIYASSLTGMNAVVQVLPITQGTVAQGNALQVSFESPLYCSQSEVLEGHCGSPIIGYAIDVASSSLGSPLQTLFINESLTIQLVRIAATSLFDAYYQTFREVNGYFQLSYLGDVSSPIDAEASADDVRDALEALSSISTVLVSRDLSSQLMSNSPLLLTPGLQYVTCALSSAQFCDFSGLPVGELISIQGMWFSVHASFQGSGSILPLGLFTDSSVPAFFNGTASIGASLYRWAR